MPGIAAILIGAGAISFALAPQPEFSTPAFVAFAQIADAPPSKPRCGSCGVVESMKRIASTDHMPTTFEISVRMHDGSIRVTNDPTPANWRPGDLVSYIEGESLAEK